MKALSYILLAVVILALLCVGFLAYMGFFNKIDIVEKRTGPYTYVYESCVGDYKDAGKVFDRVYTALLNDGVKTDRAIGIYYDDPGVVPKAELRSDCGSILEAKDFAKLPKLLEKYSIKTMESKERLTAEFPLRNSLSYMLGSIKAYPALMKYVKRIGKKAQRAVEVYDPIAGKIFYMMETE